MTAHSRDADEFRRARLRSSDDYRAAWDTIERLWAWFPHRTASAPAFSA